MYIKNIKKDYGTTSKILVYNRGTEINPPTCKLHMQISCPECYVRNVNPIPSPSSLQRSVAFRTTMWVIRKLPIPSSWFSLVERSGFCRVERKVETRSVLPCVEWEKIYNTRKEKAWLAIHPTSSAIGMRPNVVKIEKVDIKKWWRLRSPSNRRRAAPYLI